MRILEERIDQDAETRRRRIMDQHEPRQAES